MARVFLSCVSNEFKAYRDLLDQQLATANVDAIVQEHFPEHGKSVLELLDEKVRASDVVVHLVGRRTGSAPDRSQLSTFLDPNAHPERADLIARSGLAPHAHLLDRVSYTQWEYWLARAHGKTCLVYAVDPPPGAPTPDPAQADEQAAHLARIRPLQMYGRVASDWQLATRVMVSLIHGGTLAVPDEFGPPAIVLGFQLSDAGDYLSSGAIRWKGRTVLLAPPQAVPPTLGVKKAAAREVERLWCARLTDLLHRGNRALADENILVRSVVELVLPEELLSRPLREWKYTHERLRCPVPIGDWHPVRVRLAGRKIGDSAVQNIRARLELLREYQQRLERVCRQVPVEFLTSSSARPLGVVYEGGKGCWHPVAVVCVWFSAPPPALRLRKPDKNPKKTATPPAELIESELFKAVFDGVPFLVWPDSPPAQPTDLAALEQELTAMPRPADLCEHLERRPFVVYAESRDPPFPDAEQMKLDVTTPGAP